MSHAPPRIADQLQTTLRLLSRDSETRGETARAVKSARVVAMMVVVVMVVVVMVVVVVVAVLVVQLQLQCNLQHVSHERHWHA